MSKLYFESERMLERALRVIPMGTQTFSKSQIQYPFGSAPLYIEKGLGSKVWDVDGNRYIDFLNGLSTILLGYGDIDVLKMVKKQLENGSIFSLPNPIEIDVSEKIIEIVPSAEMVRFGKNGSDVTTAAIRLSRAFTGREHIASCGYHGWHDWYIGSTSRSLGVPKAVMKLTHEFRYNDISSLKNLFQSYPNKIAAVILEPMNSVYPKNNFLEEVKELTHKNGALLIFDEIVTGFRFSIGGAQELFGVLPDISTFGKGIANGFPLSVIVGKAKYMYLMKDIFFSTTFGGDTISLAAALATLNKIQNYPVIQTIYNTGSLLFNSLQSLIMKHDVENIFSLSGHPCWSFLNIKKTNNYSCFQVKTLFLQEMFRHGILTLATHVMSYSHSKEDINMLLRVYDKVFPFIKNVIDQKKLDKVLVGKPLIPVFQIR